MASEFPRHLLDIESLRREQIEEVLALSARFKRERAAARAGKGRAPRHELLPGRIVVTSTPSTPAPGTWLAEARTRS